ncbi:rhomboid family intramembrane serine protease [Chryseobacterium soli]|uniref:rhomboid family intramembrane serine protease n=1 Tax=Chryseobacterium soli TaxID=445961 RepID=UPI002955D96A|nr:rhomboid family intramembrane serine protease [Chryseobacterium soli]MDV7696598.1 rhomboid family intramembrane serine protease [Chryseobacterium soli]
MFNNIPPITRNIIIINVIMFIATFFLPHLDDILAAYYPFSPNFRSWQIITHMFMHGGYMHIIFNMFTLFSFGPILEQVLGEKKYLILYFVSGLGAFALYNLWNFVEVQQVSAALENLGVNVADIYTQASISYTGNVGANIKTPEQVELFKTLYSILRSPMLGASGAIFGVIAAFAALYPDAKIMIMFIPVPVKVKYILPIIIVVSIFLGFSGNVGGIAHFAHVGGALVGFLLAMIWKKKLYRTH